MKRKLLYLLGYAIPSLTLYSLLSEGLFTYTALIGTFFVLPIIEVILSTDKNNLKADEEESFLKSSYFDFLVYSMVPLQIFLVILFCHRINSHHYETYELIGLISALGISCGVIGINVAHELGHRVKRYEQIMAKILLSTSLYSHFFIEHNKGHHRHVSTPLDPASAQLGDNLYSFWPKSVWGSFISALKFERRKKWYKNEVVIWKIIELSIILIIAYIFGPVISLYFIAAAIFGFLLLETINYIEHYGLRRKKLENGRFERVTPLHSWNSDHLISRFVLFDLSRHSDHHANPSRKYQILRTFDESPQLPLGYPSMVLLSLVPFLWFKKMDKLVLEINNLKG